MLPMNLIRRGRYKGFLGRLTPPGPPRQISGRTPTRAIHDERSGTKGFHAGRPGASMATAGSTFTPPRGASSSRTASSRTRRPGQAAARRLRGPRRRHPASAICATGPGRRSTTPNRAISIRSRSPSAWPTAASVSSSASRTWTALVPKGTPLDAHASANSTSVYTGVDVFPMLPEQAVDRSHVAERERGPPRDRHRDRRRRPRRRRVVRRVSRDGAQQGEARLRARSARGSTAAHAAGQDGREQDADRRSSAAARSVAAPQGRAPAQRRARARDDRGDADHAETAGSSISGSSQKNRARESDRGFHDREQRRDREVSRGARALRYSARGARAGALGAHRRAGEAVRHDAARRRPTRWRSRSSSSSGARRTRIAFRISRCRS